MDNADTRTSDGYRLVRLRSIDEYKAEVLRIGHAAESSQLKSTGNWSAGQIMSHLANWISYPYEGFPIRQAPFFVRWMLRFQLRKMLRSGMPRGVRIPGVKGGTVGAEDIATADAASRLLVAIDRLQSDEEAPFDSPAFGKMSHEDRILLNLRHAELHLGFLSY